MSHAARLAKVHVATIWRWYLHGVRGRKLPTRLVGGRRYVFSADLDAFLEANDSGPRAPETNADRRADDAGKLLDAQGVTVNPRNARHPDPNDSSNSTN